MTRTDETARPARQRMTLAQRADAWYQAAYRRWHLYSPNPPSYHLEWSGDERASIAARYARLASR